MLVAAAAVAVFCFRSVQRMEPAVEEAIAPEHTIEARLEHLIRLEHAHTYVAFSEWLALGFPVVNETGVRWASRFDSMWALKGEVWRAGFDPTTAKDWPVARWVANDFIAGCPDIAVVDTRETTNYIKVLSASDPAFVRVWSHYHPITAFGGLTVYRRGKGACFKVTIAAAGATSSTCGSRRATAWNAHHPAFVVHSGGEPPATNGGRKRRCSGRQRLNPSLDLGAELGLCHRQVVRRLQPQPELRAGAEAAGQPQRQIGGHRPLILDHRGDLARRHTQRLGQAGCIEPHRLHVFLAQHPSGVHPATHACHWKPVCFSMRRIMTGSHGSKMANLALLCGDEHFLLRGGIRRGRRKHHG